MSKDRLNSALQFSSRITCLPVVHGSGACGLAVRKFLLDHPCDCLAVALPESFRYSVLEATASLPIPAIVLQRPLPNWKSSHGSNHDEDIDEPLWSYVPIDPCQPLIMALRVALGERWPIEFCDLETNLFEPMAIELPDAYALRNVSLERFAAAVLPNIPRPDHQQATNRFRYMAGRLSELESRRQNVVFVCSIVEWPWIREAYCQLDGNHNNPFQPDGKSRPAGKSGGKPQPGNQSQPDQNDQPVHDDVEVPICYSVRPETLLFMLGELPFITGLYEQARAGLEADEELSIDGVKHLLLSARSSYLQDLGKRARRISPLLLKQCLKYIRNLSLIENRMTPDMYTLGLAAQQILGDQYAIHLIQTARDYPFYDEDPSREQISMNIDQLRLPDGEVIEVVSRLPGQPTIWRSLELRRKPIKAETDQWRMRWNPYTQCSWPPEDRLIESFRTRVADRAKALIGADLARSEKFSTSIKDGIDIRETLRHWYDGDIYVKVLPPSIGTLDCVVMLFDTPADPQEYSWRTTWFAEHQNESTLAFFATDFSKEMLGPGIALATYGGALFLFPPMAIADIWRDPRLDFADDLEERLIAAACLHSRERRIALLSPRAPGARWRRIGRKFRKQLVHLPLSHFNDAMIQQLRMVHVLNGQQVRSYADHFIRKA